ncbi:pancreatic hormone [Harpia harpyja]|uniref:Pancreatic hormone n=3 Tax=Neoaves TaxID=3078114 RepID=A0A663EXJ4_AQUCH|nr:pancreatic hormone [Aquila chrysaetos chrysaetos]XP_029877455.1 pancreatic hormone [Aquila chrysaetos chrysaetos]XP_029877457.1 pancreatic hormone [Aquila chrysaetos chrysaetos]XP_052641891.1 pancreatic hormone [Harpia harpyja]
MAPRWPSLLLLACALALLAGHPGTAGPAQPTYPGDDAPVEDLVRFYNDLQQYLNVVTRHRYGKRSGSRVLCEEPFGAAGC